MLDLVAYREKQLFLKRLNKDPAEKVSCTEGRTKNVYTVGKGTESRLCACQSLISTTVRTPDCAFCLFTHQKKEND